MASIVLENVSIKGVVCTVPYKKDVNEEKGSYSEQELNKIIRMTGVKSYYRVNECQTTSDLCITSAERLLEKLNWDRSSIDGIIFVTQTPDYILPATACIIQSKLGLSNNCIAFDINLGCSGYVYGLMTASQFIQNGSLKRILLLVGDTISKVISPSDRSVNFLFGDAGSATALEFDQNQSSCSFIAGTDGTGEKNLIIPASGFRNVKTNESKIRKRTLDGNIRSDEDLFMNGSEIFNFTLDRIPMLIKDTIDLHNWNKADVDYFVLHQANKFILDYLSKKIEIDKEKLPCNIDKFGNTSSTSIPLVLTTSLRDRILTNDPLNLLLVGFGVGYSWASVALTVQGMVCAEVIYSS